MDRGTNAKRMLLGQEVPLRLGFVGIKNRSQEDIQKNMGVAEALEIEKKYFASHPVYSSLPQGHLGAGILSGKLTKILFTHIKHHLPDIIREIQERMDEVEERLKELGPSLPVKDGEKMQLVWNMVTDFCTIFKNTIGGRFDAKRGSRKVLIKP
jgi:vacuolar protein sorting-associated protein 1